MSGRRWGDEDDADQAESHLDEHAHTVRECLRAVARCGPGNHINVTDGRGWLGDVDWEPVPLMARIQELYPALLASPAWLTWHEWKGVHAIVENHRGTIRCEALRGTGAIDVWLVINNEALRALYYGQKEDEEEAKAQELADQEPSQETEGGRAGDEQE